MRHSSFEALKPACPVCRARSGTNSALFLAIEERGDREGVEAGILQCSGCGAEFPIIDGMPILVADVRRFVEENIFYLMARSDLPPAVESLLGDAAGASSGLQSIRQHVSSYVWDHWGDHDPQEPPETTGGGRPGAVVRVLEAGLDLLPAHLPEGPILDMGCGPGRVAAELAARTGRLVLAADLSVPLARAATQALSGVIEYPRRRVGMVYDRRRFAVSMPGSDKVEVWLCDALQLPFADETFALATSINLIDCVADPRTAIEEMGRILCPGGQAVIALPFDWTDRVTSPDRWLGGHSQRGPHQGRAEDVLHSLLNEGELGVATLRQHGEPVDVPWQVRLHDRSCMHYTCRVVAAQRKSVAGGSDLAG